MVHRGNTCRGRPYWIEEEARTLALQQPCRLPFGVWDGRSASATPLLCAEVPTPTTQGVPWDRLNQEG